MRIIPRSEWGARPARSRTTVDRSRRRTFVLHYDDARPTTRTGPAVPQDIQRYHMDSNGWGDIGYNFVIDQAGNIFEGRGWDTLGAHAGTAGNAEGVGVQIHIGGDQQPSAAALASARWLHQQATARFGRTLTLKGHGDYMSTSCPGGPLRAIVRNGFPAAKPAPSPAPKPAPTPVEDSVPTPIEFRQAVRCNGNQWAVTGPIVKPGPNPLIINANATVSAPAGVTVKTRWVSWSGKDWVRYGVTEHAGNEGSTSWAVGQAAPGADLRLDVWTDKPAEVQVHASCLEWVA